MLDKKLLVITYYFPPDGGGGVQRPSKFCRYLPEYGWAPIVLTRGRNDPSGWFIEEDQSLLGDIGCSTRVFRAPCAPPRSWAKGLPSIDIAGDWLESAYDAASKIIQDEGIEKVLITMSPFDLSFVGMRLQATLGVKVIYDLRDPWALDGWRLYGSKSLWRQDFRVMQKCLESASGIIANTEEAAKALKFHAGSTTPEKLCVIPNGFDKQDFSTDTVVPDGMDRQKFNIIHTGTFLTSELYRYRGFIGRLRKWKHYRPQKIDLSGRTPVHILNAIKLLKAESPSVAADVRLVFIGRADKWTLRCVEESGVDDHVHLPGYLPHTESVQWVRAADALFLPLGKLSGNSRSLIVPGKTYEYLASGRPMIAAVPDGDARDCIEKSGRGFFVDPCNASDLAGAIRRAYEQSGSMDDACRNLPDWLGIYERSRLSEKLSGFLAQL